MKVKLAAQLFSRHVANGMATEIEIKSLPEDATTTMLFIHDINNLFDTLFETFETGNKLLEQFQESHGKPNFWTVREEENIRYSVQKD